MSFSVDLWNGFKKIQYALSVKQKSTKLLLDILASYSSLEKEYCKGLDNLITELQCIKEIQCPNSVLDESINLLMFLFIEENEKHKKNFDNINKNIFEIKEELNKINKNVTPIFPGQLQNI